MEQSKRKFLKNMVGFSLMTWVSFALGFVASPIATRLFATEQLGKVNMFGTYASLISSVCYLGLDQAYVRFFHEPPGRSGRRALYTFCTVVPLLFSVVVSLGALFFWSRISRDVVGRSSFPVFLCLCLYSFSLVLFRFLSLSYRMEQNARLYTIQGVTQVFITKVAYLAVGFGNARGETVILSLTLLMSAFSLTCVMVQRKRYTKGFLSEVDKPFMSEITAYALPLVPISVLAWANNSLNLVVLNSLLGLSATAIFSSALGLATTINIIQTGFNTYYTPYVMAHYRDDSTRFYTVHRLMACLLTLFGLGISLCQTPVFLLLGKSYRSSVVFFPFLFLSPICYCLGETTGMGIVIAKKTHWTTLIYLFSAVGNVVLCFLLIPVMGMAGAALASATTAILTLALRTLLGEKYYQVVKDYRYLFYTIGLMLAASFGNLLLNDAPVPKYMLLAGLMGLAGWLYRGEISILWNTALEVLQLRRTAKTHHNPSSGKEDERREP